MNFLFLIKNDYLELTIVHLTIQLFNWIVIQFVFLMNQYLLNKKLLIQVDPIFLH
jgi:hypothetical protein